MRLFNLITIAILLISNAAFAQAQYRLGLIYANGLAVEQDYKKAIKFYKLAARKGFKSAQNRLKKLGETW